MEPALESQKRVALEQLFVPGLAAAHAGLVASFAQSQLVQPAGRFAQTLSRATLFCSEMMQNWVWASHCLE